MHQFTQLAYDLHRRRLAHAARQAPAQHLLAPHRATRRAGPRFRQGHLVTAGAAPGPTLAELSEEERYARSTS